MLPLAYILQDIYSYTCQQLLIFLWSLLILMSLKDEITVEFFPNKRMNKTQPPHTMQYCSRSLYFMFKVTF